LFLLFAFSNAAEERPDELLRPILFCLNEHGGFYFKNPDKIKAEPAKRRYAQTFWA